MHDLRVWPEVVADGNYPTTTPGKTSGKEDEMSRLAKLSKKHRNGHMPKVTIIIVLVLVLVICRGTMPKSNNNDSRI